MPKLGDYRITSNGHAFRIEQFRLRVQGWLWWRRTEQVWMRIGIRLDVGWFPSTFETRREAQAAIDYEKQRHEWRPVAEITT